MCHDFRTNGQQAFHLACHSVWNFAAWGHEKSNLHWSAKICENVLRMHKMIKKEGTFRVSKQIIFYYQ